MSDSSLILLCLQNLDDTFDDDKLRELFSEFGTITSAKVSCPRAFDATLGLRLLHRLLWLPDRLWLIAEARAK